MLDYRLDTETEALRTMVREFANEVVRPQIGAFYEADEFPTAIVRQMGELGLFGLPFPEEYGGSGGDYFTLCVALEELARVDSSVAITLEAGVSSARCRSSGSAPRSRRRSGCPACARVRRSAPSG
ncbi:acyl-CoA dehydrogenase family protein [Klenkia terrae]|uniref:acyl-CoA dehydrogenase family protein n=1 Tax=Klenkia terrae TaxID=1052259 RepID=UPI0036137AC8